MNLDKNMMLIASEGNGLGFALSLALLSKGAKVMTLEIDEALLDEVTALVEELGENEGIHLMDGGTVEGGYVVPELGELKMAHV